MNPRLFLLFTAALALLGLGGALVAGRNSHGRASLGWYHSARDLTAEQHEDRCQALALFRAEMLSAGLKEASTTRSSSSGPGAADRSDEERVTLRGRLPEIGGVTLELVTQTSSRPGGSAVTVGAQADDLRRPEARQAWAALLERLKKLNGPPMTE